MDSLRLLAAMLPAILLEHNIQDEPFHDSVTEKVGTGSLRSAGLVSADSMSLIRMLPPETVEIWRFCEFADVSVFGSIGASGGAG